MISLTLSRLIAINLPLRRVNSSRDNESARAFCVAMVTFGGEQGITGYRPVPVGL
ncbi:hypothetical protein D3C81_1873080 [compost metagenome]